MDLSHLVFRSIPHLVPFQDYTEANRELIEGLSVEEAEEIFFLAFSSVSGVHPGPKSCLAISRDVVTCSCGKDIFRSSPNMCDACSKAYFAPIQQLMKQEELDKIAAEKAKEARKKANKAVKVEEEDGNDNGGMVNPLMVEALKASRARPYRPPKAPKVRQTWKKGKGKK